MINPLKFWGQKVLPTVYEDSLSYYEVLNKINSKLNEVIESENNLTTSMATLTQQMAEFDANVDEKLDALEDSLSAQIEAVDDRVTSLNERLNGFAANVPILIQELKDYTDTQLATKANANSPQFTGNLSVTGNAWIGGTPKTGGTSYDDSDAKILATKDYVDEAIESATGAVVATGAFTPSFQASSNVYHIKQVGSVVFFDLYLGFDGETIADLTGHVLGVITGVEAPTGFLYTFPCTTFDSNLTPHVGMCSVSTVGNDIRVTITGEGTDEVVAVGGF